MRQTDAEHKESINLPGYVNELAGLNYMVARRCAAECRRLKSDRRKEVLRNLGASHRQGGGRGPLDQPTGDAVTTTSVRSARGSADATAATAGEASAHRVRTRG
uniref:Uncharacterized protein n=1 Tax=Oryza punctata TaxID=4537 RepID=A0A0E0M9D5_ORYPU